jgi:cation diffusion facilitator CzcD-associated flavoprotein CzcO
VIGAGMAGLLAAIRLREAGYSDLTVYEKGSGLGGTWRDNTYPGIARVSASR